jgi:hypothetical protein
MQASPATCTSVTCSSRNSAANSRPKIGSQFTNSAARLMPNRAMPAFHRMLLTPEAITAENSSTSHGHHVMLQLSASYDDGVIAACTISIRPPARYMYQSIASGSSVREMRWITSPPNTNTATARNTMASPQPVRPICAPLPTTTIATPARPSKAPAMRSHVSRSR